MIQVREPIPHTLSLILLAYYMAFQTWCICYKFSISHQLFCNSVYKLWKMVGLKYDTDLLVYCQMKTFQLHINSINFMFVFDVNML